MRKTIALLVMLIFIWPFAVRSAGADYNYQVDVYVNGRQVGFPGQRPFIDSKANRTYVPLRFLSEALGANVHWNEREQTTVVVWEGRIINMPIGSTRPTVDGEPRTLDAPAVLVNQRTMVPLRFVSEALGMMVGWQPPAEGKNAKVQITDHARWTNVKEFQAEGKMADRYPEVADKFAVVRESSYMRITLEDLPVRVGDSTIHSINYDRDRPIVNNQHQFEIEQEHNQGGKVIVYWPQIKGGLGVSQKTGLAQTPHFTEVYWAERQSVADAAEMWIFTYDDWEECQILILPNIFKP